VGKDRAKKRSFDSPSAGERCAGRLAATYILDCATVCWQNPLTNAVKQNRKASLINYLGITKLDEGYKNEGFGN